MYKKYQIFISADRFSSYTEDLLKYYTYRYVYICHDKDIEEKHYHIYFECSSSLTLDEISKNLNVSVELVKEVPFHIKMNNILSYFLHNSSKFDCLFQYNTSDLHSNFDFD